MHAVALICCYWYMPFLWTRFAVFYDCFAVLFGAGKLVCGLPSVVFGNCGLENCLIQHMTNAHRPIHNCNNTNVRNWYKVYKRVLWSWDTDLRSSNIDLWSSRSDLRWFAVICGLPSLISLCSDCALQCSLVLGQWFAVFQHWLVVLLEWFAVFQDWFAVICGIQADRDTGMKLNIVIS